MESDMQLPLENILIRYFREGESIGCLSEKRRLARIIKIGPAGHTSS